MHLVACQPSVNDTSVLAWPPMHLASTALLLGAIAIHAVLGRAAARPVDAFIATESPIALRQLFCNIGPDGCNVSGAGPGAIVASPSHKDPDYFYTWTRDGALVAKSLIERLVYSYDADLQRRIEQFIVSQAKLQAVSNPSGALSDGKGLGEPKYEVNLSAYNGVWGRPQRDGPALRVAALINYANWLIRNDYAETATTIIWPIVQNDLNYVAQYWNQTGFDLWEETNGSSFFTIAAQYRALVEGALLAKTLGKPSKSYSDVAPHILCFLQNFWVPSAGFVDANINVNDNRVGKDANSILASIHLFDPEIECDAATFQPCSDKALSNHKATVDSFRGYKVNSGIAKGKGVAVGRYIEDVYYGGNPWYLTTLAAAEQLYDAVYVWKKTGSVTVTDVSLAFFQDLVPGVAKGTYSSGTSTYADVVGAVSAYADGFFEVVATYVAPDGSMTEQFDKNDGHPLSARDLSWSYGAFLTAAARRAGNVPPPWAGNQAKPIPTTCSATSAVGTYSTPTATSFPPSQTPLTPPGSCKKATSVAVTFQEVAKTEFGETIKLVGDASALGGWDPSKALPLSSSAYKPKNPLWQRTLPLKAGQVIEYKYVRVDSKGSLTWEHDPNHTLTVPQTCATKATQSDKWQN